jgi:hypothetical protein
MRLKALRVPSSPSILGRAFLLHNQKEKDMTTSTVTAETIFKNWSAMHELFSEPEEALEEPVNCAQCGIDEAYERYGTDYLCESCLTLIGNVLATIQHGIEPDEDGSISVVA